ncbi:hypothetical protein DRJ17_03370 [Candidatus Woesearchaeota archaeon]|nr:MAG: hypothetical protein DRJ17_03370 [Candidatus Woesearchaeota archaeon]
MIVKVHSSKNTTILVISDKEIVGKKFSDEHIQLDLDSDFFKGREMTQVEIESLLKTANNIIFTGKKAVNLGLKKNLIEQNSILKIQGVPYAQCLFI